MSVSLEFMANPRHRLGPGAVWQHLWGCVNVYFKLESWGLFRTACGAYCVSIQAEDLLSENKMLEGGTDEEPGRLRS